VPRPTEVLLPYKPLQVSRICSALLFRVCRLLVGLHSLSFVCEVVVLGCTITTVEATARHKGSDKQDHPHPQLILVVSSVITMFSCTTNPCGSRTLSWPPRTY
jgi:hypothetical protein